MRYDNDREHDSRRDLIKRYICGYGTVEKVIRNTYGDVLSEDSKYRRERFWALRNEDDMKVSLFSITNSNALGFKLSKLS